MVRNYKLFLFAQIIALSVVAPAFAMEKKENEVPVRQLSKGRRARLFAAAIAIEEPAQGNGAAPAGNAARQRNCGGCAHGSQGAGGIPLAKIIRDLEDLFKEGASKGPCGSAAACPSHTAQ